MREGVEDEVEIDGVDECKDEDVVRGSENQNYKRD